MHEHKELTDIQKAQIVVLEHDENPTEIGKELRRTVSSFLQRYQDRGSIENLPRPGRPRETSATADRWLVRCIRGK